MYRDEIILAEKNVQLAQFESIAWSCEFGLIEHHEVIAGVLFNFGTLMLIAAIFNRQVMKPELFCQLFKISTCWITHVGPNDIGVYFAEIADVSSGAIFRKLPRVVIQAKSGDHPVDSSRSSAESLTPGRRTSTTN